MSNILKNNKINIKQIPYILISLFLIIQGCKSNNSSPVQPDPPKDPRTYTWSADTLSMVGSAQVLMRSIWGSSPKDVYAVGHNDQGHGVMWHYDGTSWTDVKLNSTFQGGNILGSLTLRAVYGFSANNIYAVGQHNSSNPNPPPNFLFTSLIIHYDGTAWIEVSLPSVGGGLNAVYGTSSNDIWAGGEDALYHYDGVKWMRDSVLVAVPSGSFFQFTSFASYNSNIYSIGVTIKKSTGEITNYLLKENNTNLAVIDSFQRTQGSKFGSELWASPNGTLYSNFPSLFKYNGTSWSNIFQGRGSITDVKGMSDDNLFITGTNSLVYHFNGTDWKDISSNLSKITNTVYRAVWTDGTEAFIIELPQTGFPQKTVIWHGK
ncbi:MAG: hypothetical protein IIB07_08720 [Bacteroidetes bacterium]|nr:hypothetical protein [Bacteroidota bacterium]